MTEDRAAPPLAGQFEVLRHAAELAAERQGLDAWLAAPPDKTLALIGVKIRLVSETDSDHPMHHPFHLHGAGRFLVLARDGVPEPNLVWKDTVLVRAGQTVDILFESPTRGCGWRAATSPSTCKAA